LETLPLFFRGILTIRETTNFLLWKNNFAQYRQSEKDNRRFLPHRKKANKIFLICKEIQSGAVAKSYMRKGFLIYEEMHNYFPIYEEAVIVIYDFATAPSELPDI
jgi:hypothetical protein